MRSLNSSEHALLNFRVNIPDGIADYPFLLIHFQPDLLLEHDQMSNLHIIGGPQLDVSTRSSQFEDVSPAIDLAITAHLSAGSIRDITDLHRERRIGGNVMADAGINGGFDGDGKFARHINNDI